MKNYFYDLLPFDVQEYILDLVKHKENWDMVVIEIGVNICHQISKDGKHSVIWNWVEKMGNRGLPMMIFLDPVEFPV